MTRAAWTVGRVVVTVAILAYVLRGFDLQAAQLALSGFSSSALQQVLMLIALDRGIMFWRWAILIRAISPTSHSELARIFFVSSFLGSFLPAGVGGDAARAFQISRQTSRTDRAVASVLIDRWLGVLAVGLSGCIGILASLADVPPDLRNVTTVLTLLLSLGSLLTLYADRLVDRLLPQRVSEHRLGESVRRLAAAAAVYRQHPIALWSVAALSLTVQVVRVTMAWVIGAGLGIPLPFRYYWVFMPFNILIILLPVSLGGFGLPQGSMVWTLGPFGVPPTDAFLLSLLFVLAGVVGNLPGAVLYAFGPARAGKADSAT